MSRAEAVEEEEGEQVSTSRRRRKHFEEDDVIAVVPDLEEEDGRGEDITKQVAEAPRNTGRKVQTLTELDSEVRFQIRGAPVGVDVGLLTSLLVPAEGVAEVDEPWEFNSLLQEVAQAMQADIDKKEADDKDPSPF